MFAVCPAITRQRTSTAQRTVVPWWTESTRGHFERWTHAVPLREASVIRRQSAEESVSHPVKIKELCNHLQSVVKFTRLPMKAGASAGEEPVQKCPSRHSPSGITLASPAQNSPGGQPRHWVTLLAPVRLLKVPSGHGYCSPNSVPSGQ
jgi:hypothetical protein